MTPFYRLAARGAIIPFLRAVSRQHVEGTENIPSEGGFIAVANHLTDLDSLTAMRAFVDADVPVYSLTKATLFKVPVLGAILRAGGQIPVQRGTRDAARSLEAARKVLAEGGAIMIFPEGTLSRDPLQWPMVAKTGAARLAMVSGAPVVPVGQWGAQDVLHTYGKIFHPFPRKEVRVKIGTPLDLSRFGSDTQDHEAVRQCTAVMMEAITHLVEDLRGEKAPRPYDMHYDGDPGKGRIGVRRPDPLPEPAEAPGAPEPAEAPTAPAVAPADPEPAEAPESVEAPEPAMAPADPEPAEAPEPAISDPAVAPEPVKTPGAPEPAEAPAAPGAALDDVAQEDPQ